MHKSTAVNWLVPLIGLLSLGASGIGLFEHGIGRPIPFTTVQGEVVQLTGHGLYAYDTLFTSATLRGTDLVTLFICIPLLLLSFIQYRRGTLAGGLLLSGVLSYFLYIGASLGLGTAYNNLFLVYIGLFSASFFAFVIVFTGIDAHELANRLSIRFPRRGMGIFMIVVGIGLAFIWLSDVVSALLANRPPTALASYTTIVTYTLDVGIIAVACLLAGIQLLRNIPYGFLLGSVLNIMLALVGVMVIGQTILQITSGIHLSPGELIGKVGSFIIMGGIAVWLTVRFFRDIAKFVGK